MSQEWRGLVVPETGEATYYFRMQRYNSGPFNWPPPAVAVRVSIIDGFQCRAVSRRLPLDLYLVFQEQRTGFAVNPDPLNSTSYATAGANQVLRTIPTSPRFSDSSGMSCVRRT